MPELDKNMTLEELLMTLDDKEVSYVFSRSVESSDTKGYENAGLSKGWWNYKDGERHDYLNDIALMIRIDTAFQAKRILAQASAQAAQVLVDQLELKRNESIKHRSAVEVLDRTVGKPSQKVEQENSGESKLIIEFVNNWREVDED